MLDQELKPDGNVQITRIMNDLITKRSTSSIGNYFNELRLNTDGSTSTFTRSWDKINASGHFVYFKTGYAVSFLELSAKIGLAAQRIQRRQSETEHFVQGANPQTVTSGAGTGALVDLRDGFAYGLQVNLMPYAFDEVHFLLSTRFDSHFNKRTTGDTTSVTLSTTGVITGSERSNDSVNTYYVEYGMMFVTSLRLESFVPYVGFGYVDGIMRGSTKSFTDTRTYVNGNLAGANQVHETLEFRFKNKNKISGVIGFSLPFEHGGVSVEARILGGMSLGVTAVVGF